MSEIILNNKMSAEYNLMFGGESYIQLEIIVGNYYENDVEISFEVRAFEINQITMDYEIVYNGSSSITIEYIPLTISTIAIEYEINPHNSMKVLYDLQMPPTVEIINSPVKDSFVASTRPYSILNYGNNISMLVGQDYKGNNISYIKFNTSNIPTGVIVKTAKIRLYYTQLADNQIIEMYRIKEDWSEYGITYENLPPIDEFLTNEYINYPDDFYIEFDVSNIVSQWVDGLTNDGVSLRSSSGLSVFRTREHPQSPQLIVEYYSPTTSILASSRVFTEFDVVEFTDNSILLEYEIHSDFRFTEVQLDYYVKAQNDIFEEFIEIEYEIVEVNSIYDDSVITIDYEITFENFDYIEFEFEIIKQESSNEISLDFIIPDKGNSSINIEYNIFGLFDSIIELQFELTTYEEDSNIEIEYYTTAYGESSIRFEFEVSLADSESNIIIEYIVRELADNNIDISYDVVVKGSSELEFEFGIIGYSDSSIELEYLPRVEFLDVIEIEYDVSEYSYYAYVYMI